ncbi:unnamed protein product [marine sediment metagenome]|uniref:Uncharacterized protein n=1 Tax=marine sediment metagenome TaxID=412755 RepID=X0S6D3_9ZZZZ
MHITIYISKYSASQTDILDNTSDSRNRYHITDAIVVFQENKEARNEVPYQALGSESDSQTSNTNKGNEGGNIHTEFRQYRDYCENQDNYSGDFNKYGR